MSTSAVSPAVKKVLNNFRRTVPEQAVTPDAQIGIRAFWIAKRVRTVLDRYAKDKHYIGNLQGLCAIASALIVKLAKSEGLPAAVLYGTFVNTTKHNRGKYRGHCWAVVGGYPNATVVDVTATQFSPQLPKIIVQPSHTAPYFRPQQIFRGVAAITRFVNEEGWAISACPSRRMLDRLAREAKAIDYPNQCVELRRRKLE